MRMNPTSNRHTTWTLLLSLVFMLLTGCIKDKTDYPQQIVDSLLLVKSIDWPTMTGSTMFITAQYQNGNLIALKRGVNGGWMDSCYFYYNNGIIDSAIYDDRMTNHPNHAIIKLYILREQNNTSNIIKFSVTKNAVIDTFHFMYTNGMLVKIVSKTAVDYTDNPIYTRYYNPYNLISEQIGFPYFTLMKYDNHGYFYGNDLDEMMPYDPNYKLDRYGRIVEFTRYGPPDFKYTVSYQ